MYMYMCIYRLCIVHVAYTRNVVYMYLYIVVAALDGHLIMLEV